MTANPFSLRIRATRNRTLKQALLAVLTVFCTQAATAEASAASTDTRLPLVAPHAQTVTTTAQSLWDLAELGYLETQSSGLLQQTLADAGFDVTPGLADIPTAFVASYGSGEPVIGILGEFDALPGISQAAVPYREIMDDKPRGHACGHNLFGAGSLGAALAVRDYLAASGQSGTVRFYGTPAEEGGSGKVYLVRAGAFADVDVVL
ncbi:MAG: M20/M25/M40 family metallo-hydrolase, partial [Halieaceae bacterium]